ncbi:transposase [Acidimicrobium ferrooxidans]|uniref:transposase n=1 Tax=Acidimicrobium ferrooxidans TaxID=53635 RepID=UPI00019DE2DC|nr:transposase [Acidimicrobium ferrooxidans]
MASHHVVHFPGATNPKRAGHRAIAGVSANSEPEEPREWPRPVPTVPACSGTIRAGDDIDVIREEVQLVLQALIEQEAAAVIGARRENETRDARCSATVSADRLLITKAGTWSCVSARLRQKSVSRASASAGACVDRALDALVMEACV